MGYWWKKADTDGGCDRGAELDLTLHPHWRKEGLLLADCELIVENTPGLLQSDILGPDRVQWVSHLPCMQLIQVQRFNWWHTIGGPESLKL